jgi:hypothetical protein
LKNGNSFLEVIVKYNRLKGMGLNRTRQLFEPDGEICMDEIIQTKTGS